MQQKLQTALLAMLLTAGAAPAQTAEPFEPELKRWSVQYPTSSAGVELRKDSVRLHNRPYLFSKTEYPKGCRISFQWAWVDQLGGPHQSDHLLVLLRSDAAVDPRPSHETTGGLRVRIDPWAGTVSIETRPADAKDGPIKTLASTTLPSEKGKPALAPAKFVKIEIIDDFKEVIVRLEGRDVLTAKTDLKAGRLIGLSNREAGPVPRVSVLRNFRVEGLK